MYKFVLSLLLISSTSFSLAANKHVHGEGHLDVALDNGLVSIDLELPLDVAVGFERKPTTEKEKVALQAAEKTLHDAAKLWLLPAAASCELESVKVESPVFEGGHADMDASYVFRCADNTAVKTLSTTLFKAFQRLKRLEVQHVSNKAQGKTRLTAQNPTLNF